MFTTRPEIRGTRAVVASTHWLASMAGWSMIEMGGNAFDAAVATGCALHVVEPHQCGFGGDMPIILQSAQSGEVEVICGQGVSPAAATIDEFRRRNLELVPGSGLLAACVPGSFGAWLKLLSDYGTLEFSDVIAPAISYARNGFAVVPMLNATLDAVSDFFSTEWTSSADTYLKNGRAPRVGELSFNSKLADTLSGLVDESKNGDSRNQRIEIVRRQFYEGFVAEEIDRFCRETAWLDSTGQRQNGLLTGADLARWQATGESPLTVDYGEYEIHKTSVWGQGPVALQQLRLLDGYELSNLDPIGPDFIHLILETAKLAFADREAWYGDPNAFDVPIETLLSKSYAAERRALIGEEASRDLRPGSPDGRTPRLPEFISGDWVVSSDGPGIGEPSRGVDVEGSFGANNVTESAENQEEITGPADGDTVHLDVADADGNLISCMPSGGWLQSSPVIPELGFCLGSRMQMFWLEAGLPSSLKPGIRPRTTLSPTLATQDGRPALAFGSPGGDQQDQWALVMFLRHIHHGLDLQAACDAPAFHSSHAPSSFYPRSAAPNVAEAESRLPDRTVEELIRRGHELHLVGDWELGRMAAAGFEDTEDGRIVKGAAQPRGAQAYAIGR
jgi:gamma-glutamyltranspeptidase/glutathione hydrolase